MFTVLKLFFIARFSIGVNSIFFDLGLGRTRLFAYEMSHNPHGHKTGERFSMHDSFANKKRRRRRHKSGQGRRSIAR